MRYPDNIEEKLGFDQIRAWLTDTCLSEQGKARVTALGFSHNRQQLTTALSQVEAFAGLLQEGDLPAAEDTLADISPLYEQAGKPGGRLAVEELYRIYVVLATARKWLTYVQDKITGLPLPAGSRELLELEQALGRSVSADGQVPDTASKELRHIRQQRLSEEGGLRKKVEQVFRQAGKQGYVPEGATVGIRNGRMVIPVKATHKRHVPGFIHDESASGSIVFLEPAAVLEANNRIVELQLAEKREIERIMRELTARVGAQLPAIKDTNEWLATLDLLRAKARLAISLEANMPVLVEDGIELPGLRHPLLVLSAGKQKRQVVPHHISLDKQERIMLISGPNAGGKSVALKSVGLNQYMLQCGLLPCVQPQARCRVFKDIFIDIGDEQSLDNDLSTYSSHLRNMAVMLRHAGPASLVLIDEFGSGTDPAFGGAIAEAVLAALLERGCYGIITTHFSNLKSFADKHEGVVNAAMLFDSDKLQPLYQLEKGRPGSSFSLVMAARAGLPEEVVQAAEEKLGAGQIKVEKLLARLEAEKQQLEEQNNQLATKLTRLEEDRQRYEQLLQELTSKKKEYLAKAREEAAALLARTNREIEKTIRHIKENQAEKQETKKARQRLQRLTDELQPRHKPDKRKQATSQAIKPGDRVLLTDRQVEGEVVAVTGKKARVMIGELQTVVPLADLQKISAVSKRKGRSKRNAGNAAQKLNEKMLHFAPVLDIRGMRAEEALPQLQRFLDEAIMLNQPEVKIVHGLGNGVLRQLVRQELKDWPQVSRYASENPDQGGEGVTRVTLA